EQIGHIFQFIGIEFQIAGQDLIQQLVVPQWVWRQADDGRRRAVSNNLAVISPIRCIRTFASRSSSSVSRWSCMASSFPGRKSRGYATNTLDHVIHLVVSDEDYQPSCERKD